MVAEADDAKRDGINSAPPSPTAQPPSPSTSSLNKMLIPAATLGLLWNNHRNSDDTRSGPPLAVFVGGNPPGTTPGGTWFLHRDSLPFLCGSIDGDAELIYADPRTGDLHGRDGRRRFLSGDLTPL